MMEGMTRRPTSPRSALIAATLVLAGVGALPSAGVAATPAHSPAHSPAQTSAQGRLVATVPAADGADVRLRRDAKGPVKSASVKLSQASFRRAPGAFSLSRRMSTTPFSMLAVTWRGSEPAVTVRVRRTGGWSRWIQLDTLTDLPKQGGPEGNGRRGTELRWVGRADGVQVRTQGGGQQVRLELINPGRLRTDRTSTPVPAQRATTPATTRGRASTRAAAAPRPALRTRRDWGANNDWRNGTPRYEKQIVQVHIHHTASSNNYTRSQVPGIIRGMYRYHTKSLGWFDIGYNFLVDKFGRTWVGRSGGVWKRVRGAHTLGFNHNSTGFAVIGNFTNRSVPAEVITALSRLGAWKLDKDGRPASGYVYRTSQGSDRYRKGVRVKLARVDGHRDTNETACPGTKLYAQLPELRQRMQRRIDRY